MDFYNRVVLISMVFTIVCMVAISAFVFPNSDVFFFAMCFYAGICGWFMEGISDYLRKKFTK